MLITSKKDSGSAKSMFDYLFGEFDPLAPPPVEMIGKGGVRYGGDLGWELFRDIHEGMKPDGKHLQKNNGVHIGGIGMSYSADKWFSDLMAISDEETRAKLQQIFDDVVLQSFTRLEEKARVARPPKAKPSECERTTKQQGSQTERVPADLIAFLAKHNTARPTQETEEANRPPDPHTHTHIYVANMAWVPNDKSPHGGKWMSIDGDDLNRLLAQFSAECTSEIARKVEDLGIKIDYIQNKNGKWRTDIGALKELSLFWSSNWRRQEKIKREFEELKGRPPTDDELRDRMAWTRLTKNCAIEKAVDWLGIVKGAMDQGIKIPTIQRINIQRQPIQKRLDELRARVLDSNGFTGSDAVFSRRKIDKTIAECAIGLGLTIEEQDDFRFLIMSELELIDPNELEDVKKKWTTKKNLSDEWTIARTLEQKDSEEFHTVPDKVVDRAIADLAKDEGIPLDAEQQELVRKACSNKGIMFIEGFAGTGKTAAMKAAVRALRDTKDSKFPTADVVVAISTARDTALRTGDKLKAEHKDSIESFLLAVKSRKIRPTKRTVIFVDESVMVDNSRMAKFLKAAGPAKIIFIGDREQLQCIGAGGWYADAVKKYGVTTLTKVHRQVNEEDISALFNLRTGKAQATMESLVQRDRVHIAESAAHRMGEAISKFLQCLDEGRSVSDVRIVFDGKNRDIDTINRIIQHALMERGLIKGEGFTMTDESNLREWKVFQGDEVSFITGYYNDDNPDDVIKITNGTKAKVARIDHKNAKVGLTSDRWKGVKWITPNAEFTPSYGIHALRLQGGEAPIILAMPGCGTTNKEAGYSQASRCIEEVHVFLDHETHSGDEDQVDPLEMIKKRWADSQQKVSATTQMKQAHAMNAAKIAKQLEEEEKERRRNQQRSKCKTMGLV